MMSNQVIEAWSYRVCSFCPWCFRRQKLFGTSMIQNFLSQVAVGCSTCIHPTGWPASFMSSLVALSCHLHDSADLKLHYHLSKQNNPPLVFWLRAAGDPLQKGRNLSLTGISRCKSMVRKSAYLTMSRMWMHILVVSYPTEWLTAYGTGSMATLKDTLELCWTILRPAKLRYPRQCQDFKMK